jgi:hypothetical protein
VLSSGDTSSISSKLHHAVIRAVTVPVEPTTASSGAWKSTVIQARTARCRAAIPPVRLRHFTDDQPEPPITLASDRWSGQAWMDSAR